MRDLKGYGRTPPHANWPGGARVAVSFVINFEEGAEMSLSSGDAFNEKTYEVTDEISGIPDRCMESHFEYGTKAAWWRIADTLERLAVSTTVSTCGQAAELSPWLIEDAVRRGHEISCHGWRRSLAVNSPKPFWKATSLRKVNRQDLPSGSSNQAVASCGTISLPSASTPTKNSYIGESCQ